MWLSACGHLGWGSWLPAAGWALEAGREYPTPTTPELWKSQCLSVLHFTSSYTFGVAWTSCPAHVLTGPVALPVCTFHHHQEEASFTHLALTSLSGGWSPFHVCLITHGSKHSKLYFSHPVLCFMNLPRMLFTLFSTLGFSPVPYFLPKYLKNVTAESFSDFTLFS